MDKRHFEISVNQKYCKQCGLCIAFCPQKVFDAMRDGSPSIARPVDCVGCMQCVRRCPDLAITVKEGESDA